MYKTYNYNDNKIIYSIVIPVYNQENIFIRNLQSVIENTLDNFEIIVILDFCTDNTENTLLKFLDNYVNNKSNFVRLLIFKNTDKPLFETKCDNIGFKNSTGIYCLEIQADMEMTQLGYNIHLTKPFNILNNVIAVSGRCAHNLYDHNGFGKLGTDIERKIDVLNVDKNSFYVLETCNRGPLLIDREKLKELNYLDENEYFLDNSDHDLMARAFLEKNYICGYVPIDFNSPLCEGSTRKHNYSECLINKNERIRLTQLFNSKQGLNKYKNIWKVRKPVIYKI